MTNNIDYVKKQIESNELIYIDTCSLMNPSRLNGFIKNVRPILLKESKKITIHYCVMEELYRLQISSNTEKRNQANKALDLIFDNHKIFNIIPTEYIEGSEYFADKELLKEIFEKRRKHTILLISNDHYLTSDAYNFNKVESVNGNKIQVCYLNHYGNLNICECAKKIHQDINLNSTYPEEQIEETKVIIQKEYIEKEYSNFEKYGFPFITLLIGTITGIAGTKLVERVKK